VGDNMKQFYKQKFKQLAIGTLSAFTINGISLPVQAANWTMLQGTEKPAAAGRARVWGFIETSYQKDESKKNEFVGTSGNNYEYVPPKLIGPDLESQDGFNVRRARIGVRGIGMPLDSNVNYFLLAEFGNNGITHGGGSSVKLTDASITLNNVPGMRMRMGAFKVPIFEEGYQAIHVFDYINFSQVANQMMLERFPNKQYKENRNNTTGFAYTDGNNETAFNQFDQPVGAFRDVGLQFFDSFSKGDWDTTYAVMYGNGNGANFSDNDENKDLYLYVSTERVYAGKGLFRQGWKMFAWSQTGKRTLYNPTTPFPTGAGADLEPGGKQEYDRKRMGLGTKYLKGQFRFTAEYLVGEGMIFLGPDNPTFTITAPGTGVRPILADGRKGKSDGYYIEGGWKIPGSKWELDARYDVYNRLTNAVQTVGPCAFNFTFATLTLGTQYHVNKKTRLTMNVEDRNYDASGCPAPAAGGNPNNNLHSIGNRYSIQMRHIF